MSGLHQKATVGNYQNTKVPTKEDDGRIEPILQVLKKSLGTSVYKVDIVNSDAPPSHQLKDSQKELRAKSSQIALHNSHNMPSRHFTR
jgi:hypothetical protein